MSKKTDSKKLSLKLNKKVLRDLSKSQMKQIVGAAPSRWSSTFKSCPNY